MALPPFFGGVQRPTIFFTGHSHTHPHDHILSHQKRSSRILANYSILQLLYTLGKNQFFVHKTLFRFSICFFATMSQNPDNLHTVRNLHLLSKNVTLISRENCRFFWVKKS